MRQSSLFLNTLHDAPSDAEVPSHKLLAQAGFIQKLAAGIYSYTPAMWRVLQKVSNIVREEMNKARPACEREGAQEVMLPILQPQSIWAESGRLDRYKTDGILFHFKDRKQADVCLGPTHEEVITIMARTFITSYKQLPTNLYQIQTKFRDEIRPRFGLLRGREFIMKDAYSFDIDEEGMDKSYRAMDAAYRGVFSRCGLEFTAVEADSGAIGGSGSHEFVVTAETGEDLFLLCDATGYAANQERAVSLIPEASDGGAPEVMEEISTPDTGTIEQLMEFFPGLPADRFAKTIIYKATYQEEEKFVAVMVRGDREINEIKLANKLDCLGLELASDADIKNLTGADVGFAGPVGLPDSVALYADESVRGLTNLIVGANKTDIHVKNVNLGRDCVEPEWVDLNLAVEGDLAVPRNDEEAALPEEQRRLRATRGIEVGHIFKLGDKYSKAMNSTFTSENGKPIPFLMGCYGIGISRTAQSAVEQNHDERGMIWPIPIAPWQVHIICVNPKQDEQREAATKLYEELTAAGVEVLFDDRKASPGVKFNDADLIGLPIRVTCGRGVKDGVVEFSLRKATDQKEEISPNDVLERVQALISEAMS